MKKEQRKRDMGFVKPDCSLGSGPNSTDSDGKSMAEDELKSLGDSLDGEFLFSLDSLAHDGARRVPGTPGLQAR